MSEANVGTYSTGFVASYRERVMPVITQLFRLMEPNRQQIGVDNPDRPIESQHVALAVGGAFATAIGSSDYPEFWSR